MTHPILYSFRRCPYAMRARMGLIYSETPVLLREIVLRDKPEHLLQISPKGTVPVLLLPEGKVLEQSLDILLWALKQNDPAGLLNVDTALALDLITKNDTDFKHALDRYKYPDRYESINAIEQRDKGMLFINVLAELLQQHLFLLTEKISFADIAIFPFVRQFALHDKEWFDANAPEKVRTWLARFLSSDEFSRCMKNFSEWKKSAEEHLFPG